MCMEDPYRVKLLEEVGSAVPSRVYRMQAGERNFQNLSESGIGNPALISWII